MGRRLLIGVVIVGVLALAGIGEVAASNVATGLTEGTDDVTVPTWLYLATGGGAIGASALLTVLITDRLAISTYRDGTRSLLPGSVTRPLGLLAGAIGLVAFGFVLVVGVVGPDRGLVSAAVLLTFVGGRAGLTMIAYLVGNPWPSLNPWRRLADPLPALDRDYPAWLGSWPAVAGLLLFVWLEIVTPLSSSAPTLVAVLLGYTVLTLAGAVVFGPGPWFRRGDPLSVWFQLYGAVAPVQRGSDGLELRPPGARLADEDLITHRSLVAYVLVLVWELTYSGFIVTEPGAETVRSLVALGLPPALVYLGLLLAGFALFWWVYWQAAGWTRRRAETYLARRYVGLRFAPSLVAIAAGYHVAHFVGFAVSLSPSLVATMTAPLSPPPNPVRYALPEWFGYVEIAGILIGHVVAVWVAHTVSFELFPGKLQAIRSEAPFVAIMIVFTMVSLYLVSLPATDPPFTPG